MSSPTSPWKIEHLRCSAFGLSAAESSGVSPWQQFTGVHPEEQLRQKTGLVREEGPNLDGNLIAETRSERTDFVLAAKPTPDGDMPIFGTFPETVHAFREQAEVWLKDISALKRLAFGVALLMPANDREQGYRQLAPFLRFELDPNSRDFVYQINRRLTSSTNPEVAINRVLRLSVAAIQRINVDATNAARTLGAPAYATRLELDINTAFEYEGALTQQHIPALWSELVERGLTLANKGDAQ